MWAANDDIERAIALEEQMLEEQDMADAVGEASLPLPVEPTAASSGTIARSQGTQLSQETCLRIQANRERALELQKQRKALANSSTVTPGLAATCSARPAASPTRVSGAVSVAAGEATVTTTPKRVSIGDWIVTSDDQGLIDQPSAGATPGKAAAAVSMTAPAFKAVTCSDEMVEKTLRDRFGFDAFRGQQLPVVQAALAGRDAAVFWATGAGKSLCYQMPALQTGRTVVVVSPLISLMHDQVAKFNATIGYGHTPRSGPRACLLGTAQVDPSVEQDAIRGDYRLVYVTPEKLTTSLLARLGPLHQRGGLCLLAIDEAHCISEWGHDFRPAYRSLRSVRIALPGLPLMAVTATAVPRVQGDIIEQLGLSNPFVSKSSFDRPNLQISCLRKRGRQADLERLAHNIVADPSSTIVYVPTQGETETVAGFLAQKLKPSGIHVRGYHGGLHPADREDAHVAFLSGQVKIMVATLAFGMGIDKPDIRRIIHYGPPKTVEEYFQQIGRAGRDGLPSVCELIANDNDFAVYANEFYTGGLTPEGKEQQLKSTDMLRSFAAGSCCRRHWLLNYFGEEPLFGERCGSCDTCVSAKTNAGDTVRDFRAAAQPLFEAIAAVQHFPQPITKLVSIVQCNWKPGQGGCSSSWARGIADAMLKIKPMRAALPKLMQREVMIKEMLSMLVSAGYVERKKVTTEGGNRFSSTFDVYLLSQKGLTAHNGQESVMLPVPQALRQEEEAQRQLRIKQEDELRKGGIDLKRIPARELEDGEGEVLDVFKSWIRKLDHYRRVGNANQAEKLEELHRRILGWRDGAAQQLRMAPANVLPDHLGYKMAYVQPTTVEELKSAGVRIAGIEELAALMQASVEELFPKAVPGQNAENSSGPACAPMLPPHGQWTPRMAWPQAIYKVGKKGQLPVWEVSYVRWTKGEAVTSIAMNQEKTPIKVETVVSHVRSAITFGKPVDIQRLVHESRETLPNLREWEQIEEASVTRGQNVDGSDYKSKEVLCGILGPEEVNVDHDKKSETQKELERVWYNKIRWWETFKRVRYTPAFEESGDAKRQRCAS